MAEQEQQNSLWHTRNNQQVKAELCNVLYERELRRLSGVKTMNLELLQKTIRSLPYYINKAADHISSVYSPLDLDSSNASWLGRQAAKPLSLKHDADKCAEFFAKNAKFALTVPISINVFSLEHVVLDTIDDVDLANERIHCNQHGWFNVNGEHLFEIDSFGGDSSGGDNSQTNAALEGQKKRLLKPSKNAFVAACCGHQWKNLHRSDARALSLRELLLATKINWQNFGKLLAVKKA